ncbi:hypothetical protein AUP68_11380 [Ilyonectria robusta]
MSHAADTWMTRHAGRSDEGDQVEQRAPTSHWDALNPQAAMQCFGLVATTGDQSISNKPGLLITRFEGGGCSSGRNGRSNGIKRDGLRVVPHRVERDGSLLLGATKHRTVPPLFFAPIVHTRVVGSTVPIYSTRSLSDSVTTTRLWRYLDGGLMRHNRCPSNCKDQIDKSRQAAARAARAYLAGEVVTRTTRQNPAQPRKRTVVKIAAHHHANISLIKKYISLLRARKVLPSGNKGSQPPALIAAEERALHKTPKVKEVIRAGAELNIPRIKDWYQEFEAVMTAKAITRSNLWNFDETPLQIGWVNSSMKLFSTRIKGKSRIVTFQPGNKDSLSAVDSISAAGQAIPSFLILTAKVLLEEYVMADINERVVLIYTATGFNNA